MTENSKATKSNLEEEARLYWAFLEDEEDPCAVVSERMEFVYSNAAWERMFPAEWYAKRCFEVFPVADEDCALNCPTADAVQRSREVVYADEVVKLDDGATYQFGIGVIPLAERSAPPAKAVLLLRRKDELHAEDFQRQLLQDARALQERLAGAR